MMSTEMENMTESELLNAGVNRQNTTESFAQSASQTEFELDTADSLLENKASEALDSAIEKKRSNAKDFIIKNGVLEKYVGKDTFVVVPDGVEVIGFSAFSNNSHILVVELPKSVVEIQGFPSCNERAFGNCTSLVEVYLNDGLKVIGDNAFLGCRNLKKIDLPDSVEVIGEMAFSFCGLESISIPNGVKSLSSTFSYCTNLRNVNLPDSLESLHAFTFNCCENLRNITLPKSLRHIGPSCFSYCNRLKSLEIPYGVDAIYDDTFLGCTTLSSLVIPETVKDIFPAFDNTSCLTSLTIPNNVRFYNDDTGFTKRLSQAKMFGNKTIYRNSLKNKVKSFLFKDEGNLSVRKSRINKI